MENKTISYLNSRVWYRLLKVTFVVGFLIVLGGFNFVFFGTAKKLPLDQSRTIIQCNFNNYKSFSPASIGLYLENLDMYWIRDYMSYENNSKIHKITDQCAGILKISDLSPGSFKVISQPNTSASGSSDFSNLSFRDKIKPVSNGFDFSKGIPVENNNLFDIKPVFIYGSFVKYFFAGNLLILLVFEFLLRAFYYIVLGTIRPKK